MAVTQVEIDTTALKRDSVQLKTVINRINSEMDNMFGSVRELGAMWEGPANEALTAQFKIDRENMREVCRAIEELIACMEEASRSYENGERNVMNVVDEIRV